MRKIINNYLVSLSLLTLVGVSTPTLAELEDGVIQLYSQRDLLGLIAKNTHLQRVKADDCQLVEDIKARAEIVKLPSYQFLYGDMLAYGVCVERDAKHGIYLMEQSAHQGLVEAIEQLGRYYHIGRFFQQDNQRALRYLSEAAGLGNVRAQLRLVGMLVDGEGSPVDYEESYHWLHNSIISDAKKRQQAKNLLSKLAKLMPQRVIERAKRPLLK
ncbi:MAG: sel1 repeat family protein [Gammaproteobacteria bacterium]|nr:sel1 repeat family protein [Gammaproteobacteria bacterium]